MHKHCESTDNNINNNTAIKWLDIRGGLETVKYTRKKLTSAEYNLIQLKDPLTVYKLTDTDELYIGDQQIRINKSGSKYVLGLDDEYTVYYYNESNGIMQPIMQFDELEAAINKLKEYQRLGTDCRYAFDIYTIIRNYISGDIGIHDAIIGIIVAAGLKMYQSHIQVLNEMVIGSGYKNYERDLPEMLKIYLPKIASEHVYTLIPLYSDIYNIFMYYQFFKESKYKVDEPDLSVVIKDIIITVDTFISVSGY